MNRFILGPLLASTLAVSVVTLSDVSYADEPAEKSEAEYSKEFSGMIQRLDQYLNKAKRRIFVFDSDLPKMQKRAEAAKYRVMTAREKYNEAQAALANGQGLSAAEQSKLRSTLEQQKNLLGKDAQKLDELVTKSRAHRSEMAELSRELKRLSDDVAIESERFPPEDGRQKKASQLVIDSGWGLTKMEELTAAWENEFEQPTTETLGQAKVE